VAETLELQEIVATVGEHIALDDEQRRQLSAVEKNFGEDAVAVLEKILAQNIGALGLEKLGAVSEPLRALILKAPANPRRPRIVQIAGVGEPKAACC
jgi:hypothetical protein